MLIEVDEGTRQRETANRNRESNPCPHSKKLGGDSVNQVFPEIAVTADARQVGGHHYAGKAVQPWDAMRAWMTPKQFENHLHNNALKYLTQYPNKHNLEDLKKAEHYLQKLIQELEARKHD